MKEREPADKHGVLYRPYRAWIICWTIYQGRHSRTRFALGCHRTGFQPLFDGAMLDLGRCPKLV